MNLNKSNAVLAVLAAALAVPTWLQLRRDAETFVDLGAVPLLFDGFTADNVATITVAMPKKEQPPPDANAADKPRVAYDQLVFQRSDKGWMLAAVPGQELAGAPVQKDRIEADVFTHLRGIRADRDTMVQPGATPAQLESFGLDEAQAFVVQAKDQSGRALADLLVGRDAGQGQVGTEAVRGVFVRKSDSNDVYLYELERGWRRDAQQELWIDRVLAKLEPEKIHRLSLRNTATAGKTFVFAREPGKAAWRAVDPPPGLGAVRQSEVENLAQRLRWIAAQEFRVPMQRAGNLQVLGLVPGMIEIELHARDGERDRVLKLTIGNRVDDKNEYYLACNESPFLMTWPGGAVTPFELDVAAQLFDPAPPPPRDEDKDERRDDKK